MQSKALIRRTFKFRCYPNKGTRRRCYARFRLQGRIWCNALAYWYRRQEAWDMVLHPRLESERERLGRDLKAKEVGAVCRRLNEKGMRPPSEYDLYPLIRHRDHPELAHIAARSLSPILTRIAGSFASYAALRKKGHWEARPPRQTRMLRTITWRQTGWTLTGCWLELPGLGRFKLRLHRSVEGTIKTVTITEDNGKWYAHFSCELGDEKKRRSGHGAVTIKFPDGRFFLVDNKRRVVQHPRFYQRNLPTVRRLSRALSRKQSDSMNRRKAKRTLAKHHEKISRQRRYFLWAEANYYASHYRRVTVEIRPIKPRIQYDLTSETAKRLCDGAYGLFLEMLHLKCQEYGTELIQKEATSWPKERELLQKVTEVEELGRVHRRARKVVHRLRFAV